MLSVTDFPVPIPEFDSCYSHQLLQADAVPYVMHREQSLKYTSLIWTLTPVPLVSGLERFHWVLKWA